MAHQRYPQLARPQSVAAIAETGGREGQTEGVGEDRAGRRWYRSQ